MPTVGSASAQGSGRDAEEESPDGEQECHLRDAHQEARRKLGAEYGERGRRRPEPNERAPVPLVEERERDAEEHAEEQKGDAEPRHVLVEGVECARRTSDARLFNGEHPGQACRSRVGQVREVEICGRRRQRRQLNRGKRG